jgi:hypothetical protein
LKGFRHRLPRLNLLLPFFTRAFGTKREQDAFDSPTELDFRSPVERVQGRERWGTDDVTDSSYRREDLCFPRNEKKKVMSERKSK